MTELGEQFLLALAEQGYGIVVTDEDVIVLSPDRSRTHFMPVEMFREPALEPILALAIASFVALEPFNWFLGEGGGEPGRN